MSEDLADAAFAGDLAEVERLLDAGADIDAAGSTWSALHAAIENEDLACVSLLLRRGANVERGSAAGVSPLAHAVDIAIDGHRQAGGTPGSEPTAIIDALLAAGAEPGSGIEMARAYDSKHLVAYLASAAKPGR
jgi:ankyrin repeat protein